MERPGLRRVRRRLGLLLGRRHWRADVAFPGRSGRTPDQSATFFACSDGNGNVTELVGVSGTTTARYEYAPFGEVLRASETGGFLNPVRFASKYHDTETGLVYYGLRYYRPSTGTWASRDPAGDTRTAARSASLSAFRAFRGLARTSCVCKGEMLRSQSQSAGLSCSRQSWAATTRS